jgi:SAM-dependent methyltransferase
MIVPEQWWQSFFSGVIVDSWLRATSEEQTRLEADFIEDMLQVKPPAKLLDVPCGGGRHSVALAARGYQMTGVDIAPEFLDAARSHQAEVAWEQRDMRDLPWPRQFDGAFCFGNCFGYLDDDGNFAFLKAVANALKPGGRFVLDVSYITELLPMMQERTWYRLGDLLGLAERHYDPVQGRLQVEYTYIKEGQIDKRAMSTRIHSCREVHDLFRRAGFTQLQAFGSLSKEPFKVGSQRLLMAAT